jgi:hypothetical protein
MSEWVSVRVREYVGEWSMTEWVNAESRATIRTLAHSPTYSRIRALTHSHIANGEMR